MKFIFLIYSKKGETHLVRAPNFEVALELLDSMTPNEVDKKEMIGLAEDNSPDEVLGQLFPY